MKIAGLIKPDGSDEPENLFKKGEEMSDTKFQLGAEVSLFKTDLVGIVDSESGCIIIRQPNAGVDAPGISIAEFIKEIKDVFKNLEIDIPDIPIPAAIEKITNGISIYLKEIFMMIKTKDPKSVDFAIWVSMDTSEALRQMFPVTINSGYLKVWNTTRKVILDEMQIGTIQKLLEQETAAKSLPEGTPKNPAKKKKA